MSLRILHLCQSGDPRLGGSLAVARALVTEQRRAGLDSRLLTLYDSPNVGAPTPVPVVSCNVLRTWRWLTGPLALHRRLRAFDPHILHHHDGLLWPLLATASRRRSLVAHLHVNRASAGRAADLAQRAISRLAARLFAISSSVADSWTDAGTPPYKIRLVPNGVDPCRFRPPTPADQCRFRRELNLPASAPILLWVGRLHRDSKGLDRLLAVARALDPAAHLVIVGDGPDRPRLERALAAQCRCHITLTGSLTEPAPYYAAADSFLFTSHVEPFGLVLLEAAASALPVFAFDCRGGARELLRLIDASMFSEAAAAQLALAALSRPARAHQVAEGVRCNFSWSRISGEVLSVYHELLSEWNPPRSTSGFSRLW